MLADAETCGSSEPSADLTWKAGGIDQVLGRNDRRMLGIGDGDRRVETLGQIPWPRRSATQLARFLADDLVVGRSAGQRLGARRGKLRDGRRAAGFGLRHVGAGTLADLEARAGGAHLLLQELEVVRPQHRDLAVANDVHESARRVEQDVLLGVAQALDGGPHPRLGGQRVVPGLKPVEQHLLDLDAERPGGQAGAALSRCSRCWTGWRWSAALPDLAIATFSSVTRTPARAEFSAELLV